MIETVQEVSKTPFSMDPEMENVKNNNGKIQENTNSTNEENEMNKENKMNRENEMNENTINNESVAKENTYKPRHRKTASERLAEKKAEKEARAKLLANMTEEEKEIDLHKLERCIKSVQTRGRKLGAWFKQIRDEKLYECTKYDKSFTLYCRATFNESRSYIYRQINYAEVLDIINESSKDYGEKVIRPLIYFKRKRTAEEEKANPDEAEQYDEAAIHQIWDDAKKRAKKNAVTAKIVEDLVNAYKERLIIGNDRSKIYVKCIGKAFNTETLVDDLIKETTKANDLKVAALELKAHLNSADIKKIQEECKKRVGDWFAEKPKGDESNSSESVA